MLHSYFGAPYFAGHRHDENSDHSVSLRQQLAKAHGTKHFQIANNAMASLPSPTSSGPSSFSSVQAKSSTPDHSTASVGCDASQGAQSHSRGRRGRSPTRRPLWTWSPEEAYLEVREEQRYWRKHVAAKVDEALHHDVLGSRLVEQQKQTVPQAPTATAQRNGFEAPSPGTSVVPMLSRPPPPLADADVTVAELAALDAQPNDDDLENGYLKAIPSRHVPQDNDNSAILYTQSQLPSLDEDNRNLWHALHKFRALHDDYAAGYAQSPRLPDGHPTNTDSKLPGCPFISARAPSEDTRQANLIANTFNWSSLHLPLHVSKTWYGVAFRSIRKKGSESINLYEADRASHEEAVRSGGLLLYWYGSPSESTGENLATCIWTSREDAVRASRLPLHKAAALHAAPAYEKYQLSRYRVVKRSGETALRVESWGSESR
ncbi:unnamed protein product [Jaminaea pallidilutea]